MTRLYHSFWVGVTIALSVAFSLLFFPVIYQEYGLLRSLLLTSVGLAVIWGVYCLRAHIFSNWRADSRRNTDRDS